MFAVYNSVVMLFNEMSETDARYLRLHVSAMFDFICFIHLLRFVFFFLLTATFDFFSTL